MTSLTQTDALDSPLLDADELENAVDRQDHNVLEDFVTGHSPSEALRVVMQLDHEHRKALLTMLDSSSAAVLIEEAPHIQAAGLIEELEIETAAHIVEELGSDSQADVIGEMHASEAEALLDSLPDSDAAEVRRLREYDPESAGGLMMTEVFVFNDSDTVSDVIHRLADVGEDFEQYRGQHPYIVDTAGKLVGVVSLRELLTSKRSRRLAETMSDSLAVDENATLDELEILADTHQFLGFPVVDETRTLVGVIPRESIARATLERSEVDSLARQGVVGDELRSMPVWTRVRRRLSWLSANIVLNMIAASVIAANEATLAAVIALAVFLPIVSDMSGCSGNQAVGVSMRELALGLIKPIDFVRVWRKEVAVGVINGVVLGILIGSVAWFWKGNAWLGLVVGLALCINTILAVSLGGTIPLMLKRFGVDPAVASGPLLTTVTDMAGFFLVLTLAAAFMPKLIGM